MKRALATSISFVAVCFSASLLAPNFLATIEEAQQKIAQEKGTLDQRSSKLARTLDESNLKIAAFDKALSRNYINDEERRIYQEEKASLENKVLKASAEQEFCSSLSRYLEDSLGLSERAKPMALRYDEKEKELCRLDTLFKDVLLRKERCQNLKTSEALREVAVLGEEVKKLGEQLDSVRRECDSLGQEAEQSIAVIIQKVRSAAPGF